MDESNIARALGDLDEADVVKGVGERLEAGARPLDLLEELQAGMAEVGERFERGDYFLSELIYAADIFRRASAPLTARLEGPSRNKLGTMVLGNARNDIHDFGKDIVAMVMSSNGIEVIDLGVNVEPEAFVAAIREHQPELVGISCLLTTVFDEMKTTVAAIAEAGLRETVKILVGGGPVDQACVDYVGADVYCRSAQDGVMAAKRELEAS